MKAKYVYESEQTKDIAITLPAKTDWSEYQKELDLVKDYSHVLNFKVPNFPTKSGKGHKCYLNYQGNIIGWMEIVGFSGEGFPCSVTGKRWDGKFIQRSGPFYKIDPIPMKGFRGFKYVDL
jgi:hypothetical protein